jgi:hypothetical protein
LRSFPAIGKDELIRYSTLTSADEAFLRKFRRSQNVLGAAVQLSALPWLGFVPDDVPAASPAAGVDLGDVHAERVRITRYRPPVQRPGGVGGLRSG